MFTILSIIGNGRFLDYTTPKKNSRAGFSEGFSLGVTADSNLGIRVS